jgi:excisionase family DNA binding protein
MMQPITSHLDLQAAADELGVHYQTAYRWVRSGRLPAHRVDGRYVVERADLADVSRARTVPEDVPAPSASRLERSAERMGRALLDGDEPTARRLARRLVDEGTPIIDLVQEVIVPPLRGVGEAWHRGELPIWVEHRSSAIVERLLGDLVPNPRGRRRGTAVVGATTGDLHSLPTTMAAVALRADQWHVHHLGADVPVDQFIECCEANGADLAVITVTNPSPGSEPRRAADLVERAGFPVLLGAPGRSLAELVEQARGRRRSSAPIGS